MRLLALLLVAASLALAGCTGGTSAPSGGSAQPQAISFDLTDREIQELARLAYVYGFAPVAVASKEYDQTHPTSGEAVYAPLNELFIDTETNTPDSQLWVSPNVNVLYASAHLDLAEQPVLIFTPEVTDRYYVWEIMDAYTNAFHYLGSRATNGAAGTYAFVGPGGSQQGLPPGTTVIECPQNSLWIVGRFEVAPGDPQDLEQVVQLVQRNVLLPLDEFVTRSPGYVNPIIQKPTPNVPALDTTGLNFFYVLNEWMTENPPPPADAPLLQQISAIGVGPNMDTDFQALPVGQQQALLAGAQEASLFLAVESLLTGDIYNGWRYNLGPNFGDWGTDYLLRAMTARGGLGANINAEAIYPLRIFGLPGESLYPDQRYRITFPSGQLPQVNDPGFWSITMYDRTTGRLVANSIDRYSIGSQNALVAAQDGSITLHIQRDDPGGDLTNNWLPTAATGDDPFYLIFRAYNPNPVMYQPFDDPGYKLPELQHL